MSNNMLIKQHECKINALKKIVEQQSVKINRLFALLTKSNIQFNVDEYDEKSIVYQIENKILLNEIDVHGYTPLIWACHNGHDKLVHDLINLGVSINIYDNDGRIALIHAINDYAHYNDTKIIDMLINARADINVFDEYECTPLMIACKRGYTKVAQALVDCKNELCIDDIDSENMTAIMHADENYHYDIVQLLIDAGAAVIDYDSSSDCSSDGSISSATSVSSNSSSSEDKTHC